MASQWTLFYFVKVHRSNLWSYLAWIIFNLSWWNLFYMWNVISTNAGCIWSPPRSISPYYVSPTALKSDLRSFLHHIEWIKTTNVTAIQALKLQISSSFACCSGFTAHSSKRIDFVIHVSLTTTPRIRYGHTKSIIDPHNQFFPFLFYYSVHVS